MLKDNLKTLRKNKGLSQEELSVKLNVVRQTVSRTRIICSRCRNVNIYIGSI